MGGEPLIEVGQTWHSRSPSARELWVTVVRRPRNTNMLIVRREPSGSEYPMAPETIRANYEFVYTLAAADDGPSIDGP